MNRKQLQILNSLVTFAMKNKGLSPEEAEVATIVRDWAISIAPKTHNYKVVNPTVYVSIETACNAWAEMGWRVVGVVSDNRPAHANSIILERPIGLSHPND